MELSHLPAFCGHDEIVKCLVDHGADVNIQDDDRMTPLHKGIHQPTNYYSILSLLSRIL